MDFGLTNIPNLPFFPAIIAVVALWDGFWKAVGLWYALKNHQRNWFIAVFLINSIGILPLVYLKFYQKKD